MEGFQSLEESESVSRLVSHEDIQLKLSKEEFTLISLFRRLSADNKKEKLLELAYLSALENTDKSNELF